MQTEVLVQLLNLWLDNLKPSQKVIDAEVWEKVFYVRFNFGRCTFVSRKQFNRRLLVENLKRESEPATASDPIQHFKCLGWCRDAIASSSIQNEKTASALNKLDRYLDDRVNVGLIRRSLVDLMEAFYPAKDDQFWGKDAIAKTLESIKNREIPISQLKGMGLGDEAIAQWLTANKEPFMKKYKMRVATKSYTMNSTDFLYVDGTAYSHIIRR